MARRVARQFGESWGVHSPAMDDEGAAEMVANRPLGIALGRRTA